MTDRIRVLVVDDSALMRKMVGDLLSEDPDILVLGHARDGREALEKMAVLNPDVVTLDIEMPVMDGVQTLTEIMATKPIPVVMLSSLTQKGAEITMKCLQLGAVDFIQKPSGSISLDLPKVGAELREKVKLAYKSRESLLRPRLTPRAAPSVHAEPPMVTSRHGSSKHIDLVLIGSSTGGPRALHTLIPCLPGNLGVPVVVVQHLPPVFTQMMALKLNEESDLTVREAVAGDKLQVGTVLVAPGGKHLRFDRSGVAVLSDEPPVHGVRPAIDVTMSSLIPLYGSHLMAVLLTGMGKDGALGLKTLRDLGGETIAEDESTCVVYGMPKAAVEMGGACQVLPLPEIADAVTQAVWSKRHGANVIAS